MGKYSGAPTQPHQFTRVCPNKKLVDWGWGLSHTCYDKASGTLPGKKKKMQWLKLMPSHIQIEIADSKRIGHCCKKQDFIVMILIDLISSWNVTCIEVERRKCSAIVYLSKFTLTKNLKFKDFIDVIFIFPRVLKFWFYLLKMYIVYSLHLYFSTKCVFGYRLFCWKRKTIKTKISITVHTKKYCSYALMHWSWDMNSAPGASPKKKK